MQDPEKFSGEDLTKPEGGNPTDWYKPGKSLQEFHQSSAFARFLVGGRGSGKTTTVAVDVVGHAWHNPGAKVLGLRKTEISQADTTVDTTNFVFGQMGDLYRETPQSLFRSWRGGLTVRIPSAAAVEKYNEFLARNPSKSEIDFWLTTEANKWCSWLEFRGLPDVAKAGNKLRGYECSIAWFIEADLMTRNDFDLTVACLRWKDAYGNFIPDTGIIIDTNPPAPSHWIAKMEEEQTLEKNYKYQFWHLKTEENAHNLPPGYVENLKHTYRKNPAMYKRMLLGEYAEAFEGSPVLYAFDEEKHAFENLPFPLGAYLVRGWDFGVTNACIFSAYWSFEGVEYWWDLGELYLEDSDTDRQARAAIEYTAVNFPFWNDRAQCAGVLDYCDPAGNARSSKGTSDINILNTYHIFPGYRTKKRTLKETIAIYNRLLEAKDATGRHVYRIDKKNCPKLYAASIGGYRYPELGEPGFGTDEPLKGPAAGNYDHPADASRYGKINCLRLAKMDVEKSADKVGVLAVKKNINPPRRWH